MNPPRGMRDLLPVEKFGRELVLAQIRKVYASRGFQEIETPALEDIEKLTSGQGGDNEKLVFQVLKRGEELEKAKQENLPLSDLGLRFDLTVPLTRYFASNHSKLPRVLKAIQIGPVWRAERPQKGRYRQFLQCDIDILGEASELAEIELLSASLAALDQIGIKNATIRVNDRRFLKRELGSLGIESQDKALIAIDKLDKIGVEGVTKEIAESYSDDVAAKVASWLKTAASETPAELSWMQKVPQAKRLRFDPTLVRGMGYYTGAIFEIEHPDSDSSIGGGGRYDSMVGKWSGTETPAVGISLGIERILDLLGSDYSNQKSLVLLIDGDVPAALEAQEKLIAEGWNVRIEQVAKNQKAQLEELNQQGFTHFAQLAESGISQIRPLA
ncbi:MAG: histidine--tRNA ligase [Actinomycetota bacterium]